MRLQRATALALQGVALLLLGLHLYVRFALPPSPPDTVPDAASVETAWWGLWPVQYLAPWQVALGAAAVLGAIGAVWLLDGERHRVSLRNSVSAPDMAASSRAPLMLATALLFAAFYLFPLAHTRWGDAYMLANGISYADPGLRLTHSWQAPLDVFLHSQVWSFLHRPLGWEDAAPAYRLLSPLAGLLYLLAALALSRDLDRDPWRVPPWLTYGLLATLGLMQLFFGYIENYSFAAAGVLGYLWLGLGVLRGERPLWLAATVLAVTNATHPSTVILAPSLLYLGWCAWQRTGKRSGEERHRVSPKKLGVYADPLSLQRNQSLLRIVGEIALPMLLIGGATFVWMEASGHGLYALFNTDRPGGSDARWFVPLWETSTRWEHYTLLSWAHLRDWLNGQLLVAPVVLPALLVVAVSLWLARRERRHGAQHAAPSVPTDPHLGVRATRQDKDPHLGVRAAWEASVRFLVAAAGFYLLFTFVWNADYGGQRDWDLFSLAALPLTLLLAVLLPRALPQRRLLRAGAAPLLVLQGWHTWAWIVQNTLPWEWPE